MEYNETLRKTLVELSKEFGESTIRDIVKDLTSKKKIARGTLINSFNYKIRPTVTKILFELESEDTFKYVNDGRKPGKFAPVSTIKDWCKTKGIDEKYAYPINLKIYRVGITPTKTLDEVLTDSRINTLSTKIENITEKKIELVISTIFKESKFNVK